MSQKFSSINQAEYIHKPIHNNITIVKRDELRKEIYRKDQNARELQISVNSTPQSLQYTPTATRPAGLWRCRK